MLDKPVKVSGTVKPGTLADVGADERFVIADDDSEYELHVKYDGAMSDDMGEGSKVVLTGSIGSNGKFMATDMALEG